MAKLAPTQIEQLQSIGAYLRQVRQEQGLSVDMLANQIFIRPALLQALESGQDAALPEPVFIQGFIRRYAEALGLDGQAIASASAGASRSLRVNGERSSYFGRAFGTAIAATTGAGLGSAGAGARPRHLGTFGPQ